MAEQFNIASFMKVVAERAVNFLSDDLHIEVHGIHYDQEKMQRLKLRYLTSLLTVEGSLRLYLAFSFDKALIEYAFEVYAEDIEVAEEERGRYIEETAADMINIIVGNVTGSLPSQGSAVSLSTPIVISEAKTIFRNRGELFYTARLETAHGQMDIHIVGPKDLFEDQARRLSGSK
ncbi:MAG: chemotaxis protein CheX [Deltaproteobacteria bacterium]|nr:chemotaxis protein CheX [Deltaproteobacteria bacterium]